MTTTTSKTLINAFNEKYCDESENETQTQTSSTDKLNFVFVGIENARKRQKEFSKYEIVGLPQLEVTEIGDIDSFTSLLPSLSRLDLSENKISNLIDIAKLALKSKKLKVLNVRHNAFDQNSNDFDSNCLQLLSEIQSNSENFDNSNLTEVVLSGNNISLDQISLFCSVFPSLENVRICEGKLANFSCDGIEKVFSSIKMLHLDFNCFEKWEDLFPIHTLPNLEELFLNNNPIKNIDFCENGHFPSLRELHLANSSISNWSSIDNLQTFPKLKNVTVIRLPLYENSESIFSMKSERNRRALVITRCPNIDILNSAEVLASERADAEKWFVSRYGKVSLENENESELFKVRLTTLTQRWKECVADSSEKSGSTSMSSNMIKIELRPVGATICGQNPQQRSVPNSLPITALKMVSARLFGLSAEKLILRAVIPELPVPEELEEKEILMTYASSDTTLLIILVDEK
eukprot:c21335_g1_i1.p1 GENE.c21335_g1_i1~~c21335_g1_i1.p1  ORF type:complete len:472 (+),score=164.69 c21335_g1_i1:29-1417(+)